MRKLAGSCSVFAGILALSNVIAAPPPFQASFDSSAKWEAIRGAANVDASIQHDKHSSVRVEPRQDTSGDSGAFVRSTPVNLTVGKRFVLSGWAPTENLRVHD